MSFDWKSFATGFLEETQEIFTERQTEAKEYEEEQRQAAERNAQFISRKRAIADQYRSYANYLSTQGFTDTQLQAILASGPRQIETIAEQVQAAVQANNNRPLTATEVDALLTLPEGFVPSDISIDEYIDATLGLSAPEVAPQEEQFGFLDRLGGRDQMARAQARLRRTPYQDGLTIEQINQMASRADYTSMQPGTFVTFASESGRQYGPDEQAEFLATYDSILDDLEDNPEYNALLDQEGKTREEIQAERRAMQIAQVNPYILSTATNYRDPQDFMDAHEAQLRIRLGDEYVDQLRIDLGIDVPEPEEEPEILQPIPRPEETDEEGTTQEPAAAPVSAPVAPPASETDVDEQVVAPETPPTPDTTVTVEDGNTYTFQSWQAMTRSEREEAGLPTSVIGGQIYFNRFGVGLGLADPQTGEWLWQGGPEGDAVDTPEGRVSSNRNAEPVMEGADTDSPSDAAAAADVDVTRQLIEDYNVDEGDIQLLQERGLDMIRFAESIGVTAQSPIEEIEAAIARFAGERQIGLPKDLTFAAQALRSGMINMRQQQQ